MSLWRLWLGAAFIAATSDRAPPSLPRQEATTAMAGRPAQDPATVGLGPDARDTDPATWSHGQAATAAAMGRRDHERSGVTSAVAAVNEDRLQ
ncbi:unnamed protein product [Urochloa humidicola]